MSTDPLLQPYKLKHLTLRNRIMTTSHEPAYPENGMPKERYTAYHAERARAGVALTMTPGSAAVSRDSPPVFNNILAYKDEVVPWIRRLTDECHEYGCAVMIQLTHLGRRTTWNKGAWLPSISSSKHREPAHRAFPKLAEDWDIERVISDFADATERMKAGGMDGVELQVFGHLLDQFWSPLTNNLDGPYGGKSLDSRMLLLMDVLRGIRKRVGSNFIVGLRYTADEIEAAVAKFAATKLTRIKIALNMNTSNIFISLPKSELLLNYTIKRAEKITLSPCFYWRTREDSNLWPLPSEGSALSS